MVKRGTFHFAQSGTFHFALTLIYAVIENNLEKAQTLLDSRAEVNWQDPKYGHSALHFVKSIPMAKLLLDHGADINLPAKNGTTALDCIIHKEFGEDVDLIQFLLSRGAHVNPQDHASLLQWPHVLTILWTVFEILT